MNINQHIVREIPNMYAGSERKATVILDDGCRYMLKQPDPTRDTHRNLSYINNVYSEYIGCHIFEAIGIPVQETKIGIYTSEDGKTKISCLCKDVCNANETLAEASRIALSSENADLNDASFENAEIIATKLEETSGLPARDTMARYYDMFVVDALISNYDRHNGNWGVITNQSTFNTRLAPVYDCGSCLDPLQADRDLTPALAKQCASGAMSALHDEHNRRICYSQYLPTTDNIQLQDALRRIVPRIDMCHIDQIVDNTPYISETRKVFYKTQILEAYVSTLLPALEHTFHYPDIPFKRSMETSWDTQIKPLRSLEVGQDISTSNGRIKRVSKGYGLAFDTRMQCIGVLRLTTG